MAKLLRIKDYVLITASLMSDVLGEARLGGGLVPSAMKQQYGFVPPNYKCNSYLSSVSKMISTKDITREVDKNGKVYLRLTSAGKERYKRRFPLFKWQGKKWDGFFMVVIYDIPEKENSVRNQLRNKLTRLGFGMLQNSVWISPYHFEEDMKEFIKFNNLENVAYVLTARRLWTDNIKSLAKKIWKLDEINKRYKEIIDEFSNVKSGNKKKRKEKIVGIWDKYFDTLSIDPLLPNEFLPKSWFRSRALKVLEKMTLQK